MDNIKVELESLIFGVMLPESYAFLEELNETLGNGSEEQDIFEAKKDVESFIEELNQILQLIDEDKLSYEDANSIYEKITAMLEEHENDKD